jgi:hypothetical protein
MPHRHRCDFARGGFERLAAGHAFVGVILEQQGARRGKRSRAVFRNQRLEIRATAQRGMLFEARRDPAGGGFHHGGIDGFVANFGDGLFEKRIENWISIRILRRHLISPM